MKYYVSRIAATTEIVKLLEDGASIEKINYKMLVKYGFGKVTVARIIQTVQEFATSEQQKLAE